MKFAVVGLIGAVIDSSVFNLLRVQESLDALNLQIPGGQPIERAAIAGTIAFILAVTSNFIWNRFWTYPDSRSKSLAAQLGLFFGINTVGLFIRVLILQYGSTALGNFSHSIIPNLDAASAGANEAWLIAVVIVMFWNFFVNRYWTYNDVS